MKNEKFGAQQGIDPSTASCQLYSALPADQRISSVDELKFEIMLLLLFLLVAALIGIALVSKWRVEALRLQEERGRPPNRKVL